MAKYSVEKSDKALDTAFKTLDYDQANKNLP